MFILINIRESSVPLENLKKKTTTKCMNLQALHSHFSRIYITLHKLQYNIFEHHQ